ncbi:protein anon-37Cs [Nilaparvata lugens]|uniref:protein anon-37Cs n=1 Tax=Nilaparvata lugens TaxID=108931 RepID=UPI000B996E79|nr:protein anon-37Cs [Nilaparvata lugens]
MKLFKRSFCVSKSLATIAQCIKSDAKKTSASCTLDANIPKPEVIIVGAGMAGLSAAASLVEAGIRNVTVLEATERLGGRIHSCWLGSSVAEIGAQWICGSSIKNPVFTLACQEGVLDPNCMIKHDFTKGSFLMSNGQHVDERVAYQASLTFNDIKQQAASLFTLGESAISQENLMDFFAMRIKQELRNFPSHQSEAAASILYSLTNHVANRWGADLCCMSSKMFGYYNKIEGETIAIPTGFISVIVPLVKTIPVESIKYSKVVETIQYGDAAKDSRVVVKCCDGSVFCADYVICTLPLGVLKAQSEGMFQPELPCEKIEAINKLGFGHVCKIFFEYSPPFWLAGQGPMKLAWSLNELSDKDNWLSGVCCLEELAGSNNILMATVAGPHAENVETLNEQTVAEDLTFKLRCIAKDNTIPYPSSVLVSKWSKSPFFMGSNTYMAVESTVGHQLDLQKPISAPLEPCGEEYPVIYFAGETTGKNFFSTVHGARISGLDVANDIIQLTRQLRGPPQIKDQKSKISNCRKEC